MKRKGCSIIFINNNEKVLLFLRDNLQGLPYPNMWDLLGGHVEEAETPDECIVREIQEEIGYRLVDFSLFKIYDFDDRVEYVYWCMENFDIDDIVLTEGQRLKWFNNNMISQTALAYGFNRVLEEFFIEAPYLRFLS